MGGGTAGLNTAIEALKKGYKVGIFEAAPIDSKLADDPTKNSILNRASEAGAQFYPYIETGLAKDDEVEQVRWVEEALNVYLEREMVGKYKQVLERRQNIELMGQKDAEPMPEYLRDVLENFGPVKEFGEIPKNPLEFTYGYDFTTLAINSPGMLRALREEFEELGGNFITQKIESVDQFYSLPGQILVNCMGLGAQNIFPRLGLEAVKGQLIFFENPGVDRIVSAEDLILLPRNSKFLYVGAGYWHSFDTKEPTKDKSEDLLSRMEKLLSIDIKVFEGLQEKLSNAKLIGSVSGFRPHRKAGILVAAEAGPKDQVVIHNVGHGGMGWTLAGTGRAAVRLIEERT